MSRLVMFLGILLIVLGGVGVIFGFVGVPAQFSSMIDQAITPTAAELCKPGETLDQVTGAEGYTPGVGYGRSVQYYCVNDAGVRRDVTGNFVKGMVGQVFGGLGSIAIPIVSSCLFVPGIILVVLGAIFARRRQQAGNVVVRSYTIGSAPNRFPFPDEPSQGSPNPTGDLSARLSKLEAVRQAGLITDAEYERARQEIINSMT